MAWCRMEDSGSRSKPRRKSGHILTTRRRKRAWGVGRKVWDEG